MEGIIYINIDDSGGPARACISYYNFTHRPALLPAASAGFARVLPFGLRLRAQSRYAGRSYIEENRP